MKAEVNRLYSQRHACIHVRVASCVFDEDRVVCYIGIFVRSAIAEFHVRELALGIDHDRSNGFSGCVRIIVICTQCGIDHVSADVNTDPRRNVACDGQEADQIPCVLLTLILPVRHLVITEDGVT